MLPPQLLQLDMKSLCGLLILLEERHVGRASERLYLSQPAMSRMLQRLREAFGDELFVRTAHGMQPTARAQALERPVRQMLGRLAHLNEPEFQPADSERTFRLLAPDCLAQACIPAILAAQYAEAPNTSLETLTLTESSPGEHHGRMADAILCSTYFQIPDSLERETLGTEQVICVLACSHPLAQRRRISLQDYLAYRHVFLDHSGNPRSIISMGLGEHARDRQFGLRTPHLLTALEAVGRSTLLLSVSRLLAEGFLERFGLTTRPLPFTFPDTCFQLCWPRTQSGDPGGEWFRDVCRRAVQPRLGKMS